MNQENDKKLCKDFPLLYRDAGLENADMCFGFECGNGWFDLIYELSAKIEKIIKEARPHVDSKAVQVKEKFGMLRFYMTSTTEEMYKLIEEAEAKSEKICELCGKEGVRRSKRGWLMVRCAECWILSRVA